MLIPEYSPLRHPPAALSRRQVLVLDGIRYAAEMADVAFGRLGVAVQEIARSTKGPTTREIAAAMSDAWTIIDATHRFRDLVACLPGLPNAPWRRVLDQAVADALELRDCVQHLQGEIEALASSGGQVWGYLSWAELDGNGHYTGKWLMMSPGSVYRGDQWYFVGPIDLPFPVPPGRIRLNAFGRQIYLGRLISAIGRAVGELARELTEGNVRPGGPTPADQRDADIVVEGYLEVVVSVPPNQGHS